MQVEQAFDRQRKGIASQVSHDWTQPWSAHCSLRGEKHTGHWTDNRWVIEWLSDWRTAGATPYTNWSASELKKWHCDFTENNPPWEADSCSNCQQIVICSNLRIVSVFTSRRWSSFPRCLFLSGFPTKILHTFLTYSKTAVRPAPPISLSFWWRPTVQIVEILRHSRHVTHIRSALCS
jgi:hypothetical protein